MSAVGRVVSGSRRPADRELWALRDDVLRLEQELAVSQAQLNKITRQYNCLVELLHKYLSFSFTVYSLGKYVSEQVAFLLSHTQHFTDFIVAGFTELN